MVVNNGVLYGVIALLVILALVSMYPYIRRLLTGASTAPVIAKANRTELVELLHSLDQLTEAWMKEARFQELGPETKNAILSVEAAKRVFRRALESR